jgi:Protein of unknown function (DUF1064)
MNNREAWTAMVEGRAPKRSKYGAVRTDGYASKREARTAAALHALARAGQIKDLREQVPIVLVPRNGKLRAVTYIADFTYSDPDGIKHYLDAKGFKTPVYRLKKRLAALLLNIEIEEV